MRKSGFMILTACLLSASVALWGQGQGGGGGNTRGGTGGTSGAGGQQPGGSRGGQTQSQGQGNYGNTNRQNDPFGIRNQDPYANQMRPLYLNGRVITSDGLPPTEPVVIQRVCTGTTYPEGYSDTKGRFSFQVGGDLSMLTSDASVSGSRVGQGGLMTGGAYTNDGIRQVGLGRYDLSACVLRAELSGYRSDDVQLGMYSTMGKNDVGMIVLHRLDGVVGDVVSALTLRAPRSAQKAYQTGLRELRKRNPNYNKAIGQFDKAVKQYPEFAAAWAAMGDAKLGIDDEDGAKQAFSESVKHDPQYLKPYEPLIRIAVDQSDWQGMESLGSAYLELNPNSTNVRFLTAIAALNSGQHDKAEEMVLAMRAGKGANRFPQSYQIMGMIHEERAEFEKAADQYRAFVQATAEPDSQNIRKVQRKLHEWEMLGVIQRASGEASARP